MHANLANPDHNTGDAADDSCISIQGLIGSHHADRLFGDSLGNELDGGRGKDLLVGRGGNDTLMGGNGSDHLVGAREAMC